jgi:hypothetical protein
MPILTVDLERGVLTQVCANCGGTHQHVISTLQLGSSAGDPDVIRFPDCDCGAVESMTRTWDTLPRDHPAEGSHFDQHRRFVNTLAQHMKSKGLSHPACKVLHATEKDGPKDMHHDSKQMRLERPEHVPPVKIQTRTRPNALIPRGPLPTTPSNKS